MEQDISSINHKCLDTNIPFGVKQIDIAEVDWILNWPDFVDANNQLGDDIEFVVDKAFVSIDLLLDSSSFKYRFDRGVYLSKVDGLVKYAGATFKPIIDLVNRKEVIVQLTLENDDRIILGSPENPLRINIDTAIGKKVGEFIGHSVAFSWTSLHVPYYSSANVVEYAYGTRYIYAVFGAGDDTMETLTITSLNEGEYTAISQDGSSGTLTIEKNGTPVTPNFTLEIGDELDLSRSSYASAGWVLLVGRNEL